MGEVVASGFYRREDAFFQRRDQADSRIECEVLTSVLILDAVVPLALTPVQITRNLSSIVPSFDSASFPLVSVGQMDCNRISQISDQYCLSKCKNA